MYIGQWSFTPLFLSICLSCIQSTYSSRISGLFSFPIHLFLYGFHVIPINVDVLHFNFMRKLFILLLFKMQSHIHVQRTSFLHIQQQEKDLLFCTNFSSMLFCCFLLLECVQHVNEFLRILELLYFYNSTNVPSGSYSQVHFSNVILYYAWCIDAYCMLHVEDTK